MSAQWTPLNEGLLMLKLADLIESQARYLAELETWIDWRKPVKMLRRKRYYSASVLKILRQAKPTKYWKHNPCQMGKCCLFTIEKSQFGVVWPGCTISPEASRTNSSHGFSKLLLDQRGRVSPRSGECSAQGNGPTAGSALITTLSG
uniref:Uncharacterized protein n=1 Tax=Heliothis virescens TaxID=7102 RepID=A0A2A4JY69_HELVI